MKCITCHEHGLIAAMTPENLLVCDMICWKINPPVIIARGQTPELNAIEAPDWCPLARCQKKEGVTKMTVNEALLQFLTSLPEAEQAGMAAAIDRAREDFKKQTPPDVGPLPK